MARLKKILPKQKHILKELGENLKLARLRRKYSAEIVAERSGISRTTLWQLEKGESATSIATLIKVLSVYGMEKELGTLAQDDELGRKLQDIGLKVNKRAPKI